MCSRPAVGPARRAGSRCSYGSSSADLKALLAPELWQEIVIFFIFAMMLAERIATRTSENIPSGGRASPRLPPQLLHSLSLIKVQHRRYCPVPIHICRFCRDRRCRLARYVAGDSGLGRLRSNPGDAACQPATAARLAPLVPRRIATPLAHTGFPGPDRLQDAAGDTLKRLARPACFVSDCPEDAGVVRELARVPSGRLSAPAQAASPATIRRRLFHPAACSRRYSFLAGSGERGARVRIERRQG